MKTGEKWYVSAGKRTHVCHCVFSNNAGEEIGMVNAHSCGDAEQLAAQIVQEHNTYADLVEALRDAHKLLHLIGTEVVIDWTAQAQDVANKASDALRKAGIE